LVDFQERRGDPRVSNSVPLKIRTKDGSFVTETGNISRSGAYCRVTKYIEPMTKMKIQLLLPIKKSDKIVNKKISCEGVVVRTEEVVADEDYNVAIFFNDISRKDIDSIKEYVETNIEEVS
jgi:hypothetical protein